MFSQFLVQFGSKALPPHHSIYKKVTAIANRILEANKDIEEIYHKQWSVTVFDQPDIANAAVLPSGAILVFSGLLDRCANEDEFAFVLAHELSHCIVGHNAELYSRTSVLNAIKIVLMGVCMALLPTDMTGILSYLFGSGTLTAAFELPYGRELEREADEVGLTLVARACYDTRYGAVFWEKMRLLEDIEMGIEIPDWISTHPANATRRDHLKGLEGSAAAVREVCKCPPLSDVDIEKEVEDFVRAVKEKHEKDRPVVLLQLPKRPVPSI
ncbi:metalloendopeptidase OMA1, mitochondrial-like isoform X2 [Artemia franciscana]|uniref:metalloendopeptidase OMA1, mitochondrial-like isoform X2 n=1 Tax=Artemia franciscana TaxID=6661 RepID=UPI0032DA3EE2